MEFNIEIENKNENFPIKIELFNLDTGEELLQGSDKTNTFIIKKNIIFENTYKLVISWQEKENMSAENDINILINSSQIKN